jgi:CBS domain-containing protein
LLDAARSAGAQLEIGERLRGVRVREVMSHDCPAVDGHINLQTFVDEHLLRSGQRCYVVEEQGRAAGIVTPHEVKGVERAAWRYKTLDEVMRPLETLRTVEPDALVTEALEVMGREDVNQLPVIREGHLAGIVSRGHILRLLQTRAELQA